MCIYCTAEEEKLLLLTQLKSNSELLDLTFICYHLGQFGKKNSGLSVLLYYDE